MRSPWAWPGLGPRVVFGSCRGGSHKSCGCPVSELQGWGVGVQPHVKCVCAMLEVNTQSAHSQTAKIGSDVQELQPGGIVILVAVGRCRECAKIKTASLSSQTAGRREGDMSTGRGWPHARLPSVRCPALSNVVRSACVSGLNTIHIELPMQNARDNKDVSNHLE